MQRAGFFTALLAVLLGELGAAQRVAAAPVDELVAAAKKEGVLDRVCSACLRYEVCSRSRRAQELGRSSRR